MTSQDRRRFIDHLERLATAIEADTAQLDAAHDGLLAAGEPLAALFLTGGTLEGLMVARDVRRAIKVLRDDERREERMEARLAARGVYEVGERC